MARALNLSFQDSQFNLGITKVDRSKLYGYTSVDVKDDNGSNCGLATISEDGKHILSKGCVGYTTLNEKNEYMAAADIHMMNKDGEALEKIPSSFDLDDIPMEVSSIEEYLTISVKSVYQLSAEEDSDISALIPILEEHMVLGSVSPFEFIGLEQKIEIVEEDEDDDDDFDFGAL